MTLQTNDLRLLLRVGDHVNFRNGNIGFVTHKGIVLSINDKLAFITESSWDFNLHYRCKKTNEYGDDTKMLDIISVIRGGLTIYKSPFPSKSELENNSILIDNKGMVYLYKDRILYRDGEKISIDTLDDSLCVIDNGSKKDLNNIVYIKHIIDPLDLINEIGHEQAISCARYSRE